MAAGSLACAAAARAVSATIENPLCPARQRGFQRDSAGWLSVTHSLARLYNRNTLRFGFMVVAGFEKEAGACSARSGGQAVRAGHSPRAGKVCPRKAPLWQNALGSLPPCGPGGEPIPLFFIALAIKSRMRVGHCPSGGESAFAGGESHSGESQLLALMTAPLPW